MDKMIVFPIFSAIEMALQVPVTASHFDAFGRHFHEVVEFLTFMDVIIMGSSILGTPWG